MQLRVLRLLCLGKYKMKDLGKIHLIIGCEVLYDEATGGKGGD